MIDGTYKILMDSPMGKQEALLSLTAEGDRLRGTVTAMGMTMDISDGKAEGNNVEFKLAAKGPMGALEITVKATASDDKITGVLKMPFGETPFEGTKVG